MKIFKKSIYNGNDIEVNAGTTGPMGGDAGHGAQTLIRFKNMQGTNMQIRTDEDEDERFHPIEKIDLLFSGDTEIETLLEGLKHIINVLEGFEDIEVEEIKL